MIKYIQHNRNFILKTYRNHMSVVCTQYLSNNHVFEIMDLGIEFFIDDGAYLQIMPAECNIQPMMLYGSNNLVVKILPETYKDDVGIFPSFASNQELCYIYPISRAYFGRIEIEQITQAQKEFINAKG